MFVDELLNFHESALNMCFLLNGGFQEDSSRHYLVTLYFELLDDSTRPTTDGVCFFLAVATARFFLSVLRRLCATRKHLNGHCFHLPPPCVVSNMAALGTCPKDGRSDVGVLCSDCVLLCRNLIPGASYLTITLVASSM